MEHCTMAALRTSLPSPASGYVVGNAVSESWIVAGSPPGHAGCKRPGGVTGLSWSAAHGQHQGLEGWSRKALRGRTSRRVGGVLTRSQGVAEVEAPVVDKVEAGGPVHTVVIVGAGIAGLSAALSLHRVGVKVCVLEQSSSIRASGTSLSLFSNAWRALEYMGVAEDLRKEHIQVSAAALYDTQENLLRYFELSECPGGPHEVRGVQRKLLVEALAAELPPGTVQLNSRVRSIRRDPGEGLTKVEMEDGSVISTKILVGCDGANSVVAKWMGLPPTRYVGQIGIRGVAEYPNGHDFGTKICQYLGSGKRCGLVPFSESKVYWFYLFCSPTPGPKVTDRNLLKAEALEGVKDGFPDKMTELVTNTPIESMSRSALSDRWNLPGLTPPLIQDGVALGGDAFHPMTPSLGQGGGTAIEDGVILAHTLGVALSQDKGPESIQRALKEYASRRQLRTLRLTIQSFVAGVIFAVQSPPLLYIRNKFILPKVVGPASFLSHTLYDVGKLPTSNVKVEQ